MSKERVNYQRRDHAGAVVSETSCLALSRAQPIDYGTFGQGAKVTHRTCRWHVQASGLDFSPRRGDRIVAPSLGTWEVLDAQLNTLETVWLCTCQYVPS